MFKFEQNSTLNIVNIYSKPFNASLLHCLFYTNKYESFDFKGGKINELRAENIVDVGHCRKRRHKI